MSQVFGDHIRSQDGSSFVEQEGHDEKCLERLKNHEGRVVIVDYHC